jgi:hypothetical protein
MEMPCSSWVGQYISRGDASVTDEAPVETGPTVAIACTPLPFKAGAVYYWDGVGIVVPSTRRASRSARSTVAARPIPPYPAR